jgi:hypothetical protein
MPPGRTPEEYRQKAAEHRRHAEAESDGEMQALLLKIAEAYEELAAIRDRQRST